MSGETEREVSAWTNDTVLQHLLAIIEGNDKRYEQRFVLGEKAVTQALDAAQRASDKADAATEKRFEGVNEFRLTLSDQARDLMPRKETETIMDGVFARITALERASGADAARARGITDYRGYLVGAGGVLIGVIGVVVAALR